MITKLRSGGLVVGLVAVLAVSLAGCNEAPPPPPTVIVNTPPADGGPVVLLTVMIVAAFVLVGVAVVCGWGWASERRARREADAARRDAEETVIALTGQPLRGALLVIDRGVGVESRAEQRPEAGRSMARWSE
jgi:heme/copper-type cytochrome/quinol oxidase subunit 2